MSDTIFKTLDSSLETAYAFISGNKADETVEKAVDVKVKTKKGLPGEMAESGIHIHGLERENSRTKIDGPHTHVFLLPSPIMFEGIGEFPAGSVLITEEDGSHEHGISGEDAVSTDIGGAHFHGVYLPSGEIVETSDDGEHQHELQVATSTLDGTHTHMLELPDGQVIQSLTPAQIWKELLGAPPQEHNPPIPQASMFALLPDHVWELLLTAEHLPIESYKNTGEPVGKSLEFNNYTKGSIHALKMPDPKFVMKRLSNGLSAGIISTAKRKSRIDKPQALVNEISPLRFDGAFMFGIVKHGECQEYAQFSDIPEYIVDGIDPYTREGLEKSVGPVYYMPLDLVRKFEAPVKLLKPPAGRRFASKIDLELDIVNLIKCVKCLCPFEERHDNLRICEGCHKDAISKGDSRDRSVRIFKSEDTGEERIVFGVVLVPNDTDAQGDIYTHEEVRKAAFGYMERNAGRMKLMHKGETLENRVCLLESYCSQKEMSFGDEVFPEGTWFMTSRIIDDGLWSEVKKGSFTGYSIGGTALRESLK